MNELIQHLLDVLDNEQLPNLPCFIEPARGIDDINFRIGLHDGPSIIFQLENADLYHLIIRDENQNMFIHPINIGSAQFIQCQEIRDNIFFLRQAQEYDDIVNENIEAMLENVENLVQPIIDMQ